MQVLLGLFALCALAFPAYSEFSISEKVLLAVSKKYGDGAVERLHGWERLVRGHLRTKPAIESSLRLTNDYFNQVRWLSDLEHWGQEDYWATPIETLASNAGDCEDFSIGKYFSLLEEAFDPEKLRITYVKSLTYDQAHMVLAYYEQPESEPLILDNINKTVLPASQRPDLVPIYSFNGKSIWLARDRGRKLKGDSQVSLPKWKQLNTRMMESLR
ncbi:MAG: transglutaminase-like cysteine peptidase [Agarilytica sp.]